MQRFLIILVLLGLTLATQVRQNVVLRKISEVTTTRSRWSITFVIDLNPYATVVSTVGNKTKHKPLVRCYTKGGGESCSRVKWVGERFPGTI